MPLTSSLAGTIREISDELRLEPHSPTRLNQAAARVDQLGRRLHGTGWVRGQEIGECLTAVVRELTCARGLPQEERAESVREAIRQLDAALEHARAGLRPLDESPETEPEARESTDDERD